MSNRYAPLPNPRSDLDAEHELEAAFDNSDDEDDDLHASETRPLTSSAPPSHNRNQSQSPPRTPGTYDFENVDYDYPPPGSPPPPSSTALPNNHGNSNGLVPDFDIDPAVYAPRRSWYQRTLTAVLPSRYAERLGYTQHRPTGAIGGGSGNDGVFANVTAKPSRPVTVREGDETYIVPEDSRAEAPPSYSSAQADAVPPYWETTVHAPFSGDTAGEMIIDSLPTGSLFSFLWNMLLSVTFQFIGFLLAHLLHTTHAARLGARAGLGVTLIQFGFALRDKLENRSPEQEAAWEEWRASSRPTYPTAAEAGNYYINGTATTIGNSTAPTLTEEQANILVADATTEWLSFFLMTIGWFILLTSLLSFWRVKRWERNILASQASNNNGSQSTRTTSQFERAFGFGALTRGEFFRQGFGFGGSRRAEEEEEDIEAQTDPRVLEQRDIEQMLNLRPDDPNRERLVAEAIANERRLQEDLRAAGLL
ncbi:hypothetical protein V5O48_004923 [Marasmius crinis-equi]|uniref:Metal homeostatis protein bsd2 n=1 Tax=Marasmius crinis-equi TaxID=585013 RepID=A0ABR3FP15_9AGAR